MMQRGQEVRFVHGGEDSPRPAIVEKIVGAGKSLAKRLDLSVRVDGEAETVSDVPHEADAEEGEAFWFARGEKRVPRAQLPVRELEGTPAPVPSPSASLSGKPKGKLGKADIAVG